jgi:hypothetical protein
MKLRTLQRHNISQEILHQFRKMVPSLPNIESDVDFVEGKLEIMQTISQPIRVR